MPPTTELHRALRTVRAPLIGMAGLSALVNLLYLTGSFLMLEVYDRVVPSRSLPTLVGLCVLALTLYAFQGALETFRAHIAGRLGLVLDERLARSAFALTLGAPLRMGPPAMASSPSVTSIRSAPSWPAAALRPCSTCRGCRSTWRSASCSTR